jgi:hypothetical protein
MARYSKATIAAAKALMEARVGPKLLSRLSGIPFHTLKEWDAGTRQAHVDPDPSTIERFKNLLAAP